MVFVLKVLPKTGFHRRRILYDIRIAFGCCLMALGLILVTLGALETGLGFDGFPDLPGTPPDPEYLPGRW